MSGEILYDPAADHKCQPPGNERVNTIWQCECGQHKRYRRSFDGYPKWRNISPRKTRRLLRKANK